MTEADLSYQNECAVLEEMIYWDHEDGKIRQHLGSELGVTCGATGWLQLLSKLKSKTTGTIHDEIEANLSKTHQYIIDDTKVLVDEAIKNKIYPGVERDLLVALCLYTSEAFYKIVNKVLRGDKTIPIKDSFDIMTKWSICIHYFIRGYRSFPSVGKCTVYRGQDANDDLKNWSSPGKIVLFEGFTSCSKNRTVAYDFAIEKKNPVIFKIESVSGRRLTPISHYPDEDEIILRPFTSFRVIGAQTEKKDGKTWTMIDLVEAYPDLRGRRVVLWVDDNHEENNKHVMDKAEKAGVTFVRLASTDEALEFLDNNKAILKRPSTRFRVITDMVREESRSKGPVLKYREAGLDLIKHLRSAKYDYKNQIYVYTSYTRYDFTCQQVESGKVDNVHVTYDEDECLTFGSFADVTETTKTDAEKE